MIDYQAVKDICRAAITLWPGERLSDAGSHLNALLRKFHVDDVEKLTASQAAQMLAYLTEQLSREPGQEG
jgi:hypothetical protein